ncbi:MAG TPA: ATP-binding protein [Acidimicrobiales bacterium]
MESNDLPTNLRWARFPLGRDASEIGRARHLAASTLSGWGVASELGGVELVVSELVTNALAHGSGPIELHVGLDGERLRIEVHDAGASASAPVPESGAGTVGGWGLQLVDQLVDDWGLEHNGGTLVWAEKRARPPST